MNYVLLMQFVDLNTNTFLIGFFQKRYYESSLEILRNATKKLKRKLSSSEVEDMELDDENDQNVGNCVVSKKKKAETSEETLFAVGSDSDKALTEGVLSDGCVPCQSPNSDTSPATFPVSSSSKAVEASSSASEKECQELSVARKPLHSASKGKFRHRGLGFKNKD